MKYPRVDKLDITIHRLMKLYSEGRLSPIKNSTWDDVKKSRYIESLLLLLPTSPLVLNAVNENGTDTFVVVDGNERVWAIIDFMGNRYGLHGLELLETLEGKDWHSLDRNYQRTLEDRVSMTVFELRLENGLGINSILYDRYQSK